MKNDYIQVRMNEEEKQEVIEMAMDLDIPVSQYVREAVREKTMKIKQAADQFAAKTETAAGVQA